MKLNAITVWLDPYTARQLSLWESAIRDSGILLSKSPTNQMDAALVSAGRCGKYGCRAGSADNTIGRMEVFDSWKHEPAGVFPRLQISNAVWRSDPPLREAVERRLDILENTVEDYNATHGAPICSIMISAGVLGLWSKHAEAEQREAIDYVVSRLKHWMS